MANWIKRGKKMSFKIVKIRLINFKRFIDYTVIPNDRVNILVGDNEVGKSSILEAIDLVANGNVHRVESIGLDRLINIDAVKSFEKGKKCFENLPSLKVELFLSDEKHDFTLNGKITLILSVAMVFDWYVNQTKII